MEALVNKKGLFNYTILEKFSAGLVLTGAEVKSIKSKRVSFEGSYITLKDGEAFWVRATIAPYQAKNISSNYDPVRPRKLLLTKKELNYLQGKSSQKGLTILPIKVYNTQAHLKLEIGVARPKKQWDKRETLRKKTLAEDAERDLRGRA